MQGHGRSPETHGRGGWTGGTHQGTRQGTVQTPKRRCNRRVRRLHNQPGEAGGTGPTHPGGPQVHTRGCTWIGSSGKYQRHPGRDCKGRSWTGAARVQRPRRREHLGKGAKEEGVAARRSGTMHRTFQGDWDAAQGSKERCERGSQ